MVSGTAAIILEKWPMLTAKDVANILFASATDLGAPGVDDVYGHGLLNVSAALQPIGATTMAVQGSAAPEVTATGAMLGAAFGDAPAFHSSLSGVMMLDSFNRDFRFNAATLA